MSLKWIPELFYDVIGRVGPGALVLVTALCAWLGPAHAWREAEGVMDVVAGKEWIFLGFVSLLSYFVGIVTSALWDAAQVVLRPRTLAYSEAERARRTALNRKISGWIEGKTSDADPDTGILSCCVNVHLPDQGVRLAKIRAEESLCKVLLVGFFLIFLLAILAPSVWRIAELSLSSSYLIGAMILSAIACWKWMGSLEMLYDRDLHSLGYLVATSRIPGTQEAAKSGPEWRATSLALTEGRPRDGSEAEPGIIILEVRPRVPSNPSLERWFEPAGRQRSQ